MKRREFMGATAGFGALTALGATPALASTKWTSGSLSPEGTVAAAAVDRFVDLVAERTSGEVEIKHFHNSQLGTTQEQMESTATGVQQMVITSGSAASSLVPEFGVIDTAFLFRDRDHFTAFMQSDMGQGLQDRMVSEFGIRVLSTNWFALPRYLLHRDKFIETADDMVGAKIRTPNLPMFLANYKAMEASPITVAYTEQYFALRQGLVDMTESAADRILSLKLHEVAPKITVCDMMFPQSTVYVNEASWQALSSDLQEIVIAAADEAGDWHTQEAIDRFDEERAAIESEGGEFMDMPEEARAALSKKIADREAEFVKDGLVPEGWLQRIREL